MKKVIVTGANGQDGSLMCKYLLNNTEVMVLGAVRRTSHSNSNNLEKCLTDSRFKLVNFDLNDVHSITSIIKDEKPDYFINFAGSTFVPDSWSSPEMYLNTNTIALVRILEAVKQFCPECRVYSSGSTDQLNPSSIYGISKNASSLICDVYRKSYNLYVVQGIMAPHESIVRLESFLTRKISKGVARIYQEMSYKIPIKPIAIGNPDTSRDWSHAKDFMDGVWRMINQEKYRSDMKDHLFNNSSDQQNFYAKNIKNYVLSSGKNHSAKELISLAFHSQNIGCYWEGTGEKTVAKDSLGRILVSVDKQFYRPLEVEPTIFDSSLIRTELGWQPKYTFEQLISEMVQNDVFEAMEE